MFTFSLSKKQEQETHRHFSLNHIISMFTAHFAITAVTRVNWRPRPALVCRTSLIFDANCYFLTWWNKITSLLDWRTWTFFILHNRTLITLLWMIITLMMVLDGQRAGEKQASTLQSLYYRLFLLFFSFRCSDPFVTNLIFSLPSV